MEIRRAARRSGSLIQSGTTKSGTSAADPEFAVIDVETTGLFPSSGDRVIEVAIVRATSSGVIRDEYCTLINPERDVGPTRIHRIKAAEVVSAPRFEDIAGDIVDRIAALPIAGHNVAFDMRFICSEFQRVGVDLPALPQVCTLALAHKVQLPAVNRRLGSCCEALGVPHAEAHSALGDARATAKLLAALLQEVSGPIGESLVSPLAPGALPNLSRSGVTLTRASAEEEASLTETYFTRLVAGMPLVNPSHGTDLQNELIAYLEVLDRALLDRMISASEAQELVQLASELGMSQSEIQIAHQTYLLELARSAMADGVVTAAERRDLLQVTRLLGLDRKELDEALRLASKGDEHKPRISGPATGKTVCFTGELTSTINGLHISREAALEFATRAGLIVKSSVTKKLDVLVAADPLSQSGKAEKARKYGIPVVAETVFWQMIGLTTD